MKNLLKSNIGFFFLPWFIVVALMIFSSMCKVDLPIISRAVNVNAIVYHEMIYDYSSAIDQTGTIYSDSGPIHSQEVIWQSDLKFKFAKSLFIQGRFKRAIKLFESSDLQQLKGFQGSYVRILEALCNYKVGELARSFEKLFSAINLHPSGQDAFTVLGHIFMKSGGVYEAEFCFREALNRAPDLAAVWVDIGDGYRGIGNWNMAEEFYRAAYSIDPNEPFALIRMAEIFLYIDKEPEKMRDFLAQAEEKRPGLSAVANLYATAETWTDGERIPYLSLAERPKSHPKTWEVIPCRIYYELVRDGWYGY